MDLAKILEILQQVNTLIAALNGMGLKLEGQLNIPALLTAFGVKL